MTFPFVRDGYRHVLVARSGLVCLVQRDNIATGSRHWEVVRLRPHGAATFPDGRHVTAGESYPTSQKWGEFGWTYTDPTMARHRFDQECRFSSPAEPETGGSRAGAGS